MVWLAISILWVILLYPFHFERDVNLTFAKISPKKKKTLEKKFKLQIEPNILQ